jgi:phi LC3 family holin
MQTEMPCRSPDGKDVRDLKINWKVRLRNPVFLMTAIPMVISLIYTTVQLVTAIQSGTFSDSYVNTIAAYVVQLLGLFGITNDPTTAGICDSERAKCYEKPYTDKK